MHVNASQALELIVYHNHVVSFAHETAEIMVVSKCGRLSRESNPPLRILQRNTYRLACRLAEVPVRLNAKKSLLVFRTRRSAKTGARDHNCSEVPPNAEVCHTTRFASNAGYRN